MDDNSVKYRQLYFNSEMQIYQETQVVSREMNQDEIEEYENIVEDSNQMTIFDFMI
ncbi:MAG: hypothetical protein SOW32_12715 [Agathobacter sp.]|nr:hypothetical protein [Agathobacter sp.]MDY3797168.1 hypothetical protein [Agathobacter sp.]